ncbi:MAG TPA: aspartate aminotransferase family protein [Solirubrobacteraceae bacterium]|jgi:putrescine aminotransferase|nr:aspartate aminotransferase family protein [Solirubrobacteraceae bacterium]
MASLAAADLAHLVHPLTNHARLGDGGPTIAVEGDGCELVLADGQRLLDGIAGLWTVNLGYGREELVKAAAAQMSKLAYCTTFGGGSSRPAIELAQRVALKTLGDESAVFLTSGGSEANETAIKLARAYWASRGRTEKAIVLAHDRGYHGLAIATTAATGLAAYRSGFGPLPQDIQHVPTPYQYRCAAGVPCDAEHCPVCRGQALEEAIVAAGSDQVAAVIIEPVLGAGGAIVPPSGYLAAVRDVCDRHEVLLIADEVITGFGRTGHWLGVDRDDVVPDLLTFAKGITNGYVPLGGVVLGATLWAWLREASDADAPLMHGFTHSGHPVACAVALACLDILERENLVSEVVARGEHLARELERLAALEEVGDVRSAGLMAGIELVADRETRERFSPEQRRSQLVADEAQRHGLRMRPLLDDILLLAPPFVISDEQLTFAVDTLGEAIVATRALAGG